MDYIDVLDKEGKLTGIVKTRTVVHQNSEWHRGAHVWILNSQNELLTQQRSANKHEHPNLWDNSAAGHVLAGEDSLSTIVRETAEELGINLAPAAFRLLFTLKMEEAFSDGTFSNEYDDIYFARADFSNFNLQTEEVQNAKWVHYLELEKMIKNNPENFYPRFEEYQKIFAFLREELNLS